MAKFWYLNVHPVHLIHRTTKILHQDCIKLNSPASTERAAPRCQQTFVAECYTTRETARKTAACSAVEKVAATGDDQTSVQPDSDLRGAVNPRRCWFR